MYNPDLGTFDQRDPIGYKGGINLYEYCSDDPTTITDPNGQQCQLLFKDQDPNASPTNGQNVGHTAVVLHVPYKGVVQDVVYSWEGSGWVITPLAAYIAANTSRDMFLCTIPNCNPNKVLAFTALPPPPPGYSALGRTGPNCASQTCAAINQGGNNDVLPERLPGRVYINCKNLGYKCTQVNKAVTGGTGSRW